MGGKGRIWNAEDMEYIKYEILLFESNPQLKFWFYTFYILAKDIAMKASS